LTPENARLVWSQQYGEVPAVASPQNRTGGSLKAPSGHRHERSRSSERRIPGKAGPARFG
jgi:hypothetical protein